jgi:Holliday junction resolvase RusA-like endonuclease
MIEFRVAGQAQPAGSKRAFVRGGHAQVVDANPRSRSWKSQVAQVAAEAYSGPLLTGALSVEFCFCIPRPKSHMGTGRNAGIVKRSAPKFPTTRPDVLKLARAVEDALTGVIWNDDAQIVEERLVKLYDDRAQVIVRVWEAEAIGDLEVVRERLAA